MISRNSLILPSIILPLGVLLASLSGCATQTSAPVPETPAAPVVPAIPEAQLNAWLDDAEHAMAQEHFTYPTQGSAQQIFQRILALDPEQEDARRGLERIVEHHVAQSMQALERRQFASARSMLARARLILPNHPSIEPSAAQIRLIMNADREVLRLSQADLQAEGQTLQTQLKKFATKADWPCRFVISAKNDAQGRWIYQTLSKGQSTGRLRAQLKVSLPATVERLCFEPRRPT